MVEEIEGAFHHTPLYPAGIGAVSEPEKPPTNTSTILVGELIIHPAFIDDKLEDKASMEIILGPKNDVKE